MRKNIRKTIPALLLCLGVLFVPLGILAGEEEEDYLYVENEWNFVENSMDVSDGIPEDAEGRLLAIKEAGKLVVATEPYFAPQEFIDPSLSGQEQYVGADMELARLIAERMGVELEIVPMEFTKVLSAVSEGEVDLAISALAFTPSRAQMMELSKGYYYTAGEDTNSLLIRETDKNRIKSINDLSGLRLIAQRGSLQESLGADNIQHYGEFLRVSTIQEVYSAVENATSDAAIVDIESARSYIDSTPGCGLMLVPEITFSMEEQYEGDRVAADKGEIMLICYVNGVIDEVLESGKYQEWYDEYGEHAKELGLEE
ncbi:MAG: transporter substrate-binding domain-containing protein [Blautia sp.]|nr:transporter substrate-binding domain-containing protein [Blautia sp.]